MICISNKIFVYEINLIQFLFQVKLHGIKLLKVILFFFS